MDLEEYTGAENLHELSVEAVNPERKYKKSSNIQSIKHRFEGGIPVVTADLTPRKKHREPNSTQTRSLSPVPVKSTSKPTRRPLMEVTVTISPNTEVTLPVYIGDSASDVANRLKCDNKSVLKLLAEEIDREVVEYMTGIAKELVQFQRLSKEAQSAKSKSALDKAKPPELQTAKRARTRERPVLGTVNVDPGTGSPWAITVREGDRAIDLAMQFCTQHGFSHSHVDDISVPIQELIRSTESSHPRFRMMLEVSPGYSAPLDVRTGDDLHSLALRFVEQYRLNKHLVKTIHDLLLRTEVIHDTKRLIKVTEVTHFDA